MDKQLRLLLLNTDANETQSTISFLKTLGFSGRIQGIFAQADFLSGLARENPQVILVSALRSPIGIKQVARDLKQAKVIAPIIVIGERSEAGEHLQLGAHDTVSLEEREHLQLVLARAARLQKIEVELQQCRTALAESERRAKDLLDSSRDAISYVHDGMHLYANNSYLDLLQFQDVDDIAGLPILDMVADAEQQRFKEFLRSYSRDPDGIGVFATQLKGAKGKVFDARMEFAPAKIDGEACTQITIRNQDLEQYILERDSVTGLYNRRYFISQLAEQSQQAASTGKGGTLVQIEIGNFDQIRKQVGVANSDTVLTQVGQAIAKQLGESTVVARFETQTFTAIVPQALEGALLEMAGKLVKSLAGQIIEVAERSIVCEVIVGMATFDGEAEPDELLSRTVKAIQNARQAGKHLELYRPKKGEMSQRQLDRMWQAEITQALAEERMHLLFQPIVHLHGDNKARYEVFIRMVDKAGKIVLPSEFLASAERSGMARDLDLWVLRHGFALILADRNQPPEVTLFVKLTAGSFQDPSVAQWLTEQLEQQRLGSHRVVIELKENTVRDYLKDAKGFIPKLRNAGCEIALDEFGGTADAFAILKHIDVEYLKLASSFMGNLRGSAENQKTLADLTRQAHDLGKQVIAQQVDDAQELQILWGIGVDYIQGNFLQPPSKTLNYDFSVLTG